jgi:hypothetical protein
MRNFLGDHLPAGFEKEYLEKHDFWRLYWAPNYAIMAENERGFEQ